MPKAKPKKPPEETILFQDGEVTITGADVDAALDEARERVGPEYADLLEAKPGRQPRRRRPEPHRKAS